MFTRILIPLDRSRLAEQALGPATAIARASHATLDVTLVREALPYVGFDDSAWNVEQGLVAEKYLQSIVARVSGGEAPAVTHAVLRGDPVDTICSRAHDIGADLIVMTSHGRTGLSRAWLGSVADGVVRRSAIPVLMLRPVTSKAVYLAPPRPFKRVLVPFDGSAFATDMLASASALARCSGARLMLLRVIQPVPLIVSDAGVPYASPAPIPDDEATACLVKEAKEELVGTLRAIAEPDGPEVEGHVIVADRVARAIIDFARANDVDVIAMSTHGRGVSRLLVGSVADKLIRASGLPVLLKRPVSIAASTITVKESWIPAHV